MSTRGPLAQADALCREYDMIPEGSCVVCALSGGADSVCLFHWLTLLRCQHPFTLIAAHYNHNLRGEESLRDEEFVRGLVARYGSQEGMPPVELVVGSGDVAGQAAAHKAGIEETARAMRYAFLRRTAREAGAQRIATAHNADDNAETLLLHLIRGSGLRGLTGIDPRRDELIRPLLTTTRADIEAYLHLHQLPHVEDSTNRDDTYTRNRVRHHLLPLLEELNPGFVPRTANTLQVLQFCAGARSTADGLCVDAAALAALPDPLATRAVRLLLGRLTPEGENCAAVHLYAVLSLCRNGSPSARADLPHGLTARRVYDRLELLCMPPPSPPQTCPLPLPGTLALPGGHITARRTVYDGTPHSPVSFYLSCAKTQQGLTLRPRCTGDALTRPGRPGRSLKKLMIDETIPRHLRDQIPVLDCGGRVAAVAGLGPDSAFLPEPGEACWHIRYNTNALQLQREKGSH